MFDSEFYEAKTKKAFEALEKVKTAEFLTETEINELIENHSSTHPFLAKRPEATPELLDKLEQKSKSLDTLIAICENPLATTETLRKIWLRNIRNTEYLIAIHPNCSSEFWNFDSGQKFLKD